MAQITSFIVSFVIVQVVFLIIRQRLRIKELQIEIERVKAEKNIEVINLENENSILKAQMHGFLKSEFSKPKIANLSTDTIQAVKYAMKHAHPDNGGNAEDFIRFKKCYEELTKR